MKTCLFVFLLICAGPVYAGDNWELAGSSQGIDSYYRVVEGSNLVEIRAITIADSRIEVIGEVLRDIPAGPQWRPNCIKSEIIKKFDRNNMVTYHITNVRWPAYDRDTLVRNTTHYDLDTGRAIIDIWSTELPSVPPKDGYVRVPYFSAKYVLEYINRDKTGIVFTTRVDPGGWIPAFVVNFFTRQYASQELLGLIRMSKKDKYISMAKGSEDEKLVESIANSPSKVKKVFTNRLKEFINDKDFIEMLADHISPNEIFGPEGEDISRTLLYSWGSIEGKKEAIKNLLKDYLLKSGYDERVVEKLNGDGTLIQMILDGSNTSEKSVPEVIKARAQALAAVTGKE